MTARLRGVMITLLVYLFSLLSMATIGTIVPFMAPLGVTLHASGGAIGLGIAVFSLPAALLATLGGALTDRLGPKRALLIAGSCAVLGDMVVRLATSTLLFDCGLLFGGIGMAACVVGAPTMLIGSLGGTTRTRAMAFWSSFAPTGYAMGLLIAIPFTANGHWRNAVATHSALAAMITAIGIFALPSVKPVRTNDGAPSARDVLTIFRHWPAMRLGLAIAIPNGISYGTSLVAPFYLARLHRVSLAESAGTVAAAKIAALLVGSLVTGQLLTRRGPPWRVFMLMALLGGLAQIVFYLPQSRFPIAICALMAWLFAFGGMSGVAMAMLPQVAPARAQQGATSGMVNQFISVISFAVPSAYFALAHWSSYVALAVTGLMIAAAVLPRTARPA